MKSVTDAASWLATSSTTPESTTNSEPYTSTTATVRGSLGTMRCRMPTSGERMKANSQATMSMTSTSLK